MSTQAKLFDDFEQLLLPEELMDYVPAFFSKAESDQLLTLGIFLSNIRWSSVVKKY